MVTRDRIRQIIYSDPRVPGGSRSVNRIWGEYVADIIDRRTGASIDRTGLFLIDLDCGLIGRYPPNPKMLGPNAEIRHEHAEHEFIRGDFIIIWRADTP
jgi:hypothetical protein